MTMFDDREKAAERKFVREQEVAFKVKSRRNMLLGLWAAGHMGLIGEAGQRYAQTVVDAEMTGHDDQLLVKKVYEDLVAAGNPIPLETIRDHLAALQGQAMRDARASPQA